MPSTMQMDARMNSLSMCSTDTLNITIFYLCLVRTADAKGWPYQQPKRHEESYVCFIGMLR